MKYRETYELRLTYVTGAETTHEYEHATDPKPVADVQLRNELRQAGVKPEFEEK